NEAPPAAVRHDLDTARASIERVLDQFLDHARGALDHLARGDAVDDGLGQLADRHGSTRLRSTKSRRNRWVAMRLLRACTQPSGKLPNAFASMRAADGHAPRAACASAPIPHWPMKRPQRRALQASPASVESDRR